MACRRGRAARAAAARTSRPQRMAGGDPQLLGDEIQVGHEFGHAVLHLQSRIDLEEPEPAIRIEQELGRRRVVQARRASGPNREVVERRALVVGQTRRRRFLEQLLVAALDRAVAFAERDQRAVAVAQQLDLDVASRADLALQVDRPVAEGGQRFGGACGQRGRQLRRGRDPAHAASSPAGRCLDQQREADTLGGGDDGLDRIGAIRRRRLERAGHDRHADRVRGPSRRKLVAQGIDRVGVRADEHQPGLGHEPGERGALGQEAVARMDRLRAGLQRRLDDPVGAQIAVGRRRRTEPHRPVGSGDMRRIDIGIGVHGDRRDAQVSTGPDDPQRDLATVGDEHRVEWAARVFAYGQRRDGRASQRDVPVLLARVRVALVGEHGQRSDQARSRLRWADDVIHVAARRRVVGIGKPLFVVL